MNHRTRMAARLFAGMASLMLIAGCFHTTPPPETPVELVKLVPGQGPVPRRTRSLSVAGEQSIAWQNNDDRGHTIRFTDWPFREPQQDILVPAGGTSAVFHLYKYQDPTKYTYAIYPPVKDDPTAGPPIPGQQLGQGPPDPPDVVADP